jgi:hypothetical protein
MTTQQQPFIFIRSADDINGHTDFGKVVRERPAKMASLMRLASTPVLTKVQSIEIDPPSSKEFRNMPLEEVIVIAWQGEYGATASQLAATSN